MTQRATLRVDNFAQIKSVTVPLSDLVLLVGPQATGKSLVLQLLKLAKDRTRIVRTLKQHGFSWTNPKDFISVYFGAGFETSWQNTNLQCAGSSHTITAISKSRAREGEDSVFYIPAHRTLTIAEGWPRPFLQYQVDTPYVVRRFSEQLLELLQVGIGGASGKIFPPEGRLKAAFKTSIDDAVFHGATLNLEETGMRRQFVLNYADAKLPFMTWTAGQREFIPLLLGLYRLLTAGKVTRRPDIDWVIIEEPEMGLHPKAIVAVMGAVLELMHRGYRVALSTHSPTVLEVVWALRRLRGHDDGPSLMCDLFEMQKSGQVIDTMRSALAKSTSVISLSHGDDARVVSEDISDLSPTSSEEAERGWGGLTRFSGRVSEVVARVSNAPQRRKPRSR